MRRKIILSLIMTTLLSGETICAETEQSVIINGTEIDKIVSNLTFNGSNVTLQFEDNTSQTEDISLVNISFSYQSTTDISNTPSFNKPTQIKIYNLNGQYMGNNVKTLKKGVYIINGKKTVIN